VLNCRRILHRARENVDQRLDLERLCDEAREGCSLIALALAKLGFLELSGVCREHDQCDGPRALMQPRGFGPRLPVTCGIPAVEEHHIRLQARRLVANRIGLRIRQRDDSKPFTLSNSATRLAISRSSSTINTDPRMSKTRIPARCRRWSRTSSACCRRCPPRVSAQLARALLLLGFVGGFRRSELIALDVAHLEFSSARLVVTLRRAKTARRVARGASASPSGFSERGQANT
jgi:hypothetical protein